MGTPEAYWAHDAYLSDRAADLDVARALVDLADDEVRRVAVISKRVCIERGLVDGSDAEEALGAAITIVLACVIAFLFGVVLAPALSEILSPFTSFLVVGQ